MREKAVLTWPCSFFLCCIYLFFCIDDVDNVLMTMMMMVWMHITFDKVYHITLCRALNRVIIDLRWRWWCITSLKRHRKNCLTKMFIEAARVPIENSSNLIYNLHGQTLPVTIHERASWEEKQTWILIKLKQIKLKIIKCCVDYKIK